MTYRQRQIAIYEADIRRLEAKLIAYKENTREPEDPDETARLFCLRLTSQDHDFLTECGIENHKESLKK